MQRLGVDGELDRYVGAGGAVLVVPGLDLCQGGNGGEFGHGGAGAGDDEGAGEVECVGGGDAGVEWGWVGDDVEGGDAEEGVVAGFGGEDGGWALDEAGVGEGEAGGHVDDGADAGGGDDVGEVEKFFGVGDGELVLAGLEGGFLEVVEDVLGGLDVDELLLLVRA